MAAYLITGASGTGKTSVAKELRRRGYLAYDGDATLAYHADPETHQPMTETLDSYAQTAWLWNQTRLRELLDTESDVILTGGPPISASSTRCLPESSF